MVKRYAKIKFGSHELKDKIYDVPQSAKQFSFFRAISFKVWFERAKKDRVPRGGSLRILLESVFIELESAGQ